MIEAISGKLAEIERMKREIARTQAEIDRLDEQIAEAERRGLDGFDEERFMKPRPKKVSSDAT